VAAGAGAAVGAGRGFEVGAFVVGRFGVMTGRRLATTRWGAATWRRGAATGVGVCECELECRSLFTSPFGVAAGLAASLVGAETGAAAAAGWPFRAFFAGACAGCGLGAAFALAGAGVAFAWSLASASCVDFSAEPMLDSEVPPPATNVTRPPRTNPAASAMRVIRTLLFWYQGSIRVASAPSLRPQSRAF
jgi:hypothetical protein